MKIFMTAVSLLLTLNAFAVSECKNYVGETPYKGEITAESREIGFNNCPESVLVNDKFVARLYMVKDSKGAPACVYTFGSATFVCKNN